MRSHNLGKYFISVSHKKYSTTYVNNDDVDDSNKRVARRDER